MLRPCLVHKSALVLILSQMNPVYTLLSHLIYILILSLQIFHCLPGSFFFTTGAGFLPSTAIYLNLVLILFCLACLLFPAILFHQVLRPKFRMHFSLSPLHALSPRLISLTLRLLMSYIYIWSTHS